MQLLLLLLRGEAAQSLSPARSGLISGCEIPTLVVVVVVGVGAGVRPYSIGGQKQLAFQETKLANCVLESVDRRLD